MISISGSLKIFLLVECCDMRKGFNGLYGLVSSSFGEDPRSGALYVFCNRRHTRVCSYDRPGVDRHQISGVSHQRDGVRFRPRPRQLWF